MNADDFGLTAGVNRAIRELHEAGALTSTTLMARGTATEEAIRIARVSPALGVGCHVVLVDGEPVLPREMIPSLINRRTGCFYPKLGKFLRRLQTGRIRSEEIQAEAEAQIALLQSNGLVLTHVDTHKHVHMFPAVLRPILSASAKQGILAVRNPFEPAWSRRATLGAPLLRRVEVRMMRILQPAWKKTVRSAGFETTDGAIGVLATGTLDEVTVSSLLSAMPSGTWELVTHPGYCDEELARLQTRLLASRDRERKALLNQNEYPAIERISFAGLRTKAETGP